VVLIAATLAAAVAPAAVAGPARASELVYKGCIAARSPSRTGKGPCKVDPQARVYASTLEPSPDGQSLYTGIGIPCDKLEDYCSVDATVGRFDLESPTGSLNYRSCVTGVADGRRTTCTQIPHATPDATGAGLGDIQSMVVSPDGNSMYAASPNPICADADCYGSNALARFDRNPTTGAITYRGCATGDTRSGPSGSGACSEIPSASADGTASGLNGLQSLAVSADGKSLYGTATRDSAIATFDRDPQTGALTYRGCITGDKRSGLSGSGACRQIPTATADGSGSGLNGCCGSPFSGRPSPYPVLVSPDGTSVYVGADGLAQFDRDPATGRLTYVGCIAGKRARTAGKACTQIPGRMSDEQLVMSPDGRFVYAAGYGSGIAELRRNSKTGALVYVGVVKDKGDSLAIGDNGRVLYTGSYSDRRVSWYSVDPKSGRPRYTGCLTGNKGEKSCTPIRTATGGGYDSGLEKVGVIAASGRMLYAYGGDDDIAHFTLAPQTHIKKAKARGKRATFKFRAHPKSKLECKLKGEHVGRKLRHWRKCGSHGLRSKGKQTYRHLGSGKKVFRVRATDRSKTTDPTPAKKSWQVP
jgi:hypothetical protein